LPGRCVISDRYDCHVTEHDIGWDTRSTIDAVMISQVEMGGVASLSFSPLLLFLFFLFFSSLDIYVYLGAARSAPKLGMITSQIPSTASPQVIEHSNKALREGEGFPFCLCGFSLSLGVRGRSFFTPGMGKKLSSGLVNIGAHGLSGCILTACSSCNSIRIRSESDNSTGSFDICVSF
jgi:hypothetical protein